MNDVNIILIVTAFLGGCFLVFYQFIYKWIGKLHYKTIDESISNGVLSKNPTREEIKQWIRQYVINPSESQITDTLNYITDRKSTK